MSRENPESFIFYESFYEAISALHNDELELSCFRALAEYGLYRKRPRKIPDVAKSLVTGFSYQIDAARRNRVELSERMSELGKKGGKAAAKKKQAAASKSQATAKKKQATASKSQATAGDSKLNVNDNDNVNENVNVFSGGGAAAPAAREKKKNCYGDFHNVWLTSEEYANLAYQLGSTWKAQLEKLSAYKKSHAKFKSDDDYATLKLWRTNELAKNESNHDKADSDPEDTTRREIMLDKALDDAVEDLWKDAEKNDEET